MYKITVSGGMGRRTPKAQGRIVDKTPMELQLQGSNPCLTDIRRRAYATRGGDITPWISLISCSFGVNPNGEEGELAQWLVRRSYKPVTTVQFRYSRFDEPMARRRPKGQIKTLL